MGPRFRVTDRKQPMLFPPSLDDLIDENDLVRIVADAVDQFDLSAIEANYNQDGEGRSAIDPAAMLATLIYAYANKVLSSRQIEILCRKRVEFRWISGQSMPDHATIARFRNRHSAVFQDLFAQVLDMVRRCGLGQAGTIILDGTKLKGNAALDQNRTLQAITRELTEAAQIRDLVENAKYGKKRGDEVPRHMRGAENRRKRLEEAKRQLEAEQAGTEPQPEPVGSQEGKARKPRRRVRYRKGKAVVPEPEPEPKRNITDPESRILKGRHGFLQGYNAQAVVSRDQIILAAAVTQDANDQKQLLPMIEKTMVNVARTAVAGAAPEIRRVLADAGYHSAANLSGLERLQVEGFIPSKKAWKLEREIREKGRPRGRMKRGLTLVERMERKLRTGTGGWIYKARSKTIEPVFGQIKHGFEALPRRGLKAAQADWALLCLGHNLKKLWKAKGSE